jgi:hypothetical protein
MSHVSAERVIHCVWSVVGQAPKLGVYAILDAARDERVRPALLRSECPYVCLYQGRTEQELAEVAPYLVQLSPTAAFTTSLIQDGWGESWGILVGSAASLAELRNHFRKFLMVRNNLGKLVYFRYYDPRVLRVYLPTCNAAELELLFGPVDSYMVEGEDAGTLIRYAHAGGKLEEEVIELEA